MSRTENERESPASSSLLRRPGRRPEGRHPEPPNTGLPYGPLSPPPRGGWQPDPEPHGAETAPEALPRLACAARGERSRAGAEASRRRFASPRAAPRRGPLRRDEAARSGSPGAEPAAPRAPNGPPRAAALTLRLVQGVHGGRRQPAAASATRATRAPRRPTATGGRHRPGPARCAALRSAPPRAPAATRTAPQQRRASLASLPIATPPPQQARPALVKAGKGRGEGGCSRALGAGAAARGSGRCLSPAASGPFPGGCCRREASVAGGRSGVSVTASAPPRPGFAGERRVPARWRLWLLGASRPARRRAVPWHRGARSVPPGSCGGLPPPPAAGASSPVNAERLRWGVGALRELVPVP